MINFINDSKLNILNRKIWLSFIIKKNKLITNLKQLLSFIIFLLCLNKRGKSNKWCFSHFKVFKQMQINLILAFSFFL